MNLLLFRCPPAIVEGVFNEELVPECSDGRSGQVPQGMCVDDPEPRRKVEQLECCCSRGQEDEDGGLRGKSRAV